MRLPTLVLCALVVMVLSQRPGYSNTGLPHEFDSLVPVFASAQPVGTRYTRDSVTVSFATRDAFIHVVAFYMQALQDTGWQVSTSDTGKRLVAAKKRVRLTLSEKTDDQGFIINLQYPGGRE